MSFYRMPISKNISNYLIGLQTVWILTGVIPVFLLFGLQGMEFGFLPVMAFSVVIISSLRLSFFSAQNEKRIISMTFWVFVYVFLGLTPFLQLLSKHLPLGGSYGHQAIKTTFFIIFYGLLFYEIGWWVGCKRLPHITGIIRKFVTSRYVDFWKASILSLTAFVLIVFIVLKLGGIKSLLLPREEQLNLLIEITEKENQAKLQIVAALLKVPIFIVLILFYSIWNHERITSVYNNRFAVWKKLLFFLIIILNIFINNPISSPRYWFGTIVLSLIYLSVRWRNKLSFAILGIAITSSLLFVFPLSDIFRHTTDIEKVALRDSGNIIYPLVNKGDYDSFQQIINTTEYVEDHSISFGKQLVGTFMFWVPRNLWSGKPIASGVVVSEYKGYEYTNLSLPLWGEAYMDGGFLGVIIIFTLYGVFVGIAEKIYIESKLHGINFINIFVPVFAAYQFFLLRGTLMSAFAYLIPILFFMFIGTKKLKYKNL